MDWPYIHLLINHFPIILSVTGASAAIVSVALRRRGIWLYAVATLTLAGLAIYPAFLSGDEAADTFERLPPWYIARGSIHSHEEAAEATLWIVLAVGIVAAYAWWRSVRDHSRADPPGWLRGLVVLSSLVGLGFVTWTSLLGGKIVHKSPILAAPRPPAVGAPPPSGAGAPP
jgi:hypothetical protein